MDIKLSYEHLSCRVRHRKLFCCLQFCTTKIKLGPIKTKDRIITSFIKYQYRIQYSIVQKVAQAFVGS